MKKACKIGQDTTGLSKGIPNDFIFRNMPNNSYSDQDV